MAFPESVPVLTDGVVTLRAHTPDDLTALAEQASDPLSQRWTTVPRDYTRLDAEQFLEVIQSAWDDPAGTRFWAIECTDDRGRPAFCGTIDLRPEPAGAGTVGFGLHPAARGRGLMSRALRLVCRHAFEEREMVRVHWSAHVGNFDSRRVAWACGFTFHGTIPQSLRMPGEPPADGWMASLGAGEEMAPKAPWFVPPVLEGDRIRLRPWRDEDRDAAEPIGHPAHHMPSPWASPTADTFDAWLLRKRELMARGQAIQWCVADRETDRAVGTVLVFVHEGFTLTGSGAELGYWLFPSGQGRGAAREAAWLAVDHAFGAKESGGLGLHRLSAVTAADNEASNAVLTATGFTCWGTEHQTDQLEDGSWADAKYWELLNNLD